ncbi:DUF4199 domain-containing protein [Maribacter litopenaei]|uniref:DUF4199 domain-containing protein n=1 Tax=Maribacter litopenaei TaxID=2976127 RepID=A0ABY5Y3W1_9FLAO|nr:DUF4199 domain-containing protein [Maribacter litopenaei]UWX53695.1 DUF4199 domain-containing protein [Maribacter litopenaei]
MEENKPKTGKFALIYGAILGGISMVFGLMLFSADMHYQGGIAVMLISLALSIAGIVIALIQFRKANGGFMSFSQALKVGVGVSLVAGIIGIIFNQLMANVIDPDMMAKAMELQRNQLMETTSLTPEQIDAQMEMGKKFSTPTMQIVFGLIFSLFVGFVISLISGLILKRQED